MVLSLRALAFEGFGLAAHQCSNIKHPSRKQHNNHLQVKQNIKPQAFH